MDAANTVFDVGEQVIDSRGCTLSFFIASSGVVCGSIAPVSMLNVTIRLSASLSGV